MATMTPEETKAFVREVFRNVFEDVNATEETVRHYFSESYENFVDARHLTFPAFLNTIKYQKDIFSSIRIEVEDMIAEGEQCLSHHHSTFLKKTGEEVKLRVMLLFHIRDHKIVSGKGLTMGEIHKVLHPRHEHHGKHNL